jgi:hypothetical protein
MGRMASMRRRPIWLAAALGSGDIGGTSRNDDYSWEALGVVGYRFGLFGENDADLLAGYKVLEQSIRTATAAAGSNGTSPCGGR